MLEGEIMNCVRCGGEDNLEEHHIVELLRGGNDEPENKEWRCRPCHKYEHTRRGLEVSIAYEQERGQQNRIRYYKHRLEVLERLNTPEIIRNTGIYVSYWADRTTRYLPRRIPTKEEAEEQQKLELLLSEAFLKGENYNPLTLGATK